MNTTQTTFRTTPKPIGDNALAEFAAGLRGTAVLPGDADYDQARSIWNGAHDRYPALIAQCAGVADVMRTVNLARSEGIPLAVRGGGHSIPGFSTLDAGILLDLSRMTGIEVHPDDRTVTAQAGCTWKDLDAETQQFGLAVTGGLVSSTGIAGFTTGGGIGWLMRKHGLACDNLIGADVVTADGTFLHASASENADLFWGLRGGGGNFGVVTAFEYQLHEVGPTVLSGLVFYPADEIEQVLAGYRAACAAAPDELTTLINLTTAPPVPFLPESVHGTPIIAVGGCWSGDLDAGEAATSPFRALGTVISDVFTANPYAGWQQALDPLYPRGIHNYFRAAFQPELTDRALRVLQESFATLPNALAEIHVQHLGGAVGSDSRAGHGVRHARPGVHRQRHRPHSGCDRFRRGHRLGARRHSCARTRRQHLRQLHRGLRPDSRPGVLPARDLPAARGAEEPIRPDQPLPPQPEHRPHRMTRQHDIHPASRRQTQRWRMDKQPCSPRRPRTPTPPARWAWRDR